MHLWKRFDRSNSAHTRHEFLELVYALNHYQKKADSGKALNQERDMPGERFTINWSAQIVLACRI